MGLTPSIIYANIGFSNPNEDSRQNWRMIQSVYLCFKYNDATYQNLRQVLARHLKKLIKDDRKWLLEDFTFSHTYSRDYVRHTHALTDNWYDFYKNERYFYAIFEGYGEGWGVCVDLFSPQHSSQSSPSIEHYQLFAEHLDFA